MLRLAWPALVVIAVTSCAAPPPPPPAQASAAAPAPVIRSARGPIDGTYRGRSTATMNTRNCAAPGPVTVVITNGSFSRRFTSTSTVEATVAPDGTISGQSGRTRVSGTVQNGHMEADIGNEYCGYHWTLDRS